MNLSVARRQQGVRLRNPSPDPLACSLNASHPNPKPKVRLQKLKPKPPLRPVIEWYMLLIVGCALYTWWCAPRKASTETKSSFGTGLWKSQEGVHRQAHLFSTLLNLVHRKAPHEQIYKHVSHCPTVSLDLPGSKNPIET